MKSPRAILICFSTFLSLSSSLYLSGVLRRVYVRPCIVHQHHHHRRTIAVLSAAYTLKVPWFSTPPPLLLCTHYSLLRLLAPTSTRPLVLSHPPTTAITHVLKSTIRSRRSSLSSFTSLSLKLISDQLYFVFFFFLPHSHMIT